jgi:Ca2+-transporting ATPase
MVPDVNDSEFGGLTSATAQKILQKGGFNELPSQKSRGWLSILTNVLKEPMLFLLLATGTIYLFLGEIPDASMLMGGIILVLGITFYQERKTERALEALKSLSSPRALVIRDGERLRIPGREVVIGDVMIIREGDRIPADSQVLSANNLMVDESLLTGESLPVKKFADDRTLVYSGTLVTQGHGVVRAVFTGTGTQMGKIGKSLENIREEDTLIKKDTSRIVIKFGIFGLGLCLIIFLIYGLSRGNWLQGLLAGLTLTMSMLPEEFTVILVVFLTLGAWRMSKHKVLTRKTAAIETLGAATVLCVDKTGTITLNKIGLSGLYQNRNYFNLDSGSVLPENYHPLLEYALLASQQDPFDPLEKAISKSAKELLTDAGHVHNDWKMIKEYPLSRRLFSISRVWQSPDSQVLEIAAKGAPEAIAGLCHFTRKENLELERKINEFSGRGLRLIGVASASFKSGILPSDQHDFNFKFLGLLAFSDPVRPGVKEALAECYTAGIRVIMITGDYPGTAEYVAGQIGLKNPAGVIITGTELAAMDPADLSDKLRTTCLFARVAPEQKLLIVDALKRNGEIVAMTGDGVNDAPALKSAQIGIAMGQRGTDVAREAADLVLLDDDFSSIVDAVRMGRRIFDNLKKAITYIFAVHVPIAGMSLIPVVFRLPVVLLPAHIAFLELIIDPACSVVFESETEEPNIMRRPPRRLNESLFSRANILVGIIQGMSILAVVLLVYLFAVNQGRTESNVRTLAFTIMVFSNLLLIVTDLSRTGNLFTTLLNRNRSLYWVLGITVTSLLVILSSGELRKLFHFSTLTPGELLVSFSAGLVSILWFEGLKKYRRSMLDI